MGVVVYTSSATASTSVRKQQSAIKDFLDSHKIEYVEVDLCVHTGARTVMLEKIPAEYKDLRSGCQTLPPQVFYDDTFLGDYEMFSNAREMGLTFTFFKQSPPVAEQKVLKEFEENNIPISFY